MNRPYPPPTVHQGIAQRVKQAHHEQKTVSEGIVGVCIGALDRLVSKTGRYKVFKYLFGKESSKDLSPYELWALVQWCKPDKIENQWACQEYLEDECKLIIKGMDFGVEHPYLENKFVVEPDKEWIKNVVANKNPAPADRERVWAETVSEWYVDYFGKHKYRMYCGHHNDSYDVAGNPVCTKCAPEWVAHAIMYEVENGG